MTGRVRRGRARPDPVLAALFAAAVLSSALFLAGPGPLRPRLVVFWSVQVGGDLVTAVLAGAVARGATRQPVRRFWFAARIAGFAFAAGDLLKLVLTALNPHESQDYRGGQALFFVGGYLVVIAAMITYPTAPRTANEHVRYWLDAATVLTGTGVFAWCLLVSPVVTGASLDNLAEGLISSGAVVLIGFAVVKLLLSGDTPITRTGVLVVVAAVVLQSSGDTLLVSGSQEQRDDLLLVIRVLAVLAMAAVPRIQQVQSAGDPRPRPRRRPYSMLPYVTLVAVFTLLSVQLAPHRVGTALVGALAGMALITGLVVVRQLSAFEENAELLRRLEHQASHDPLTGLANRAAFTERLAALSGEIAVVLVDLDGFKQVNDTLGHHAGDMMLVAVAQRLRAGVRDGDSAARLGGDEFAMLLPGADATAAAAVVERFLALLTQPVDIEGTPVQPRASIGAAVGTDPDPDVLLRTADAAMYRVKHAGKGTYAVVAVPTRPDLSVAGR
jgi:diguanylate cyclase